MFCAKYTAGFVAKFHVYECETVCARAKEVFVSMERAEDKVVIIVAVISVVYLLRGWILGGWGHDGRLGLESERGSFEAVMDTSYCLIERAREAGKRKSQCCQSRCMVVQYSPTCVLHILL